MNWLMTIDNLVFKRDQNSRQMFSLYQGSVEPISKPLEQD